MATPNLRNDIQKLQSDTADMTTQNGTASLTTTAKTFKEAINEVNAKPAGVGATGATGLTGATGSQGVAGAVGTIIPSTGYATISALTTAFPTGNVNPYITSDGQWNMWNGSAWVAKGLWLSGGIGTNTLDTTKYKTNSINRQKTNFYSNATLNLFDLSLVTNGGYYSSTTGLWSTDATLSSSGFIAVVAGQQYIILKTFGIAYFDANYNFISGVSGQTTVSFTIPAGVTYMTFCIYPSATNTTMLVLGTTTPTYVPYKVTDTQLMVYGSNVGLNTLGNTSYKDSSVSRRKTSYYMPATVNLFDLISITTNGYYSPSTGVWVIDLTLDCSAFLPVVAGQQYNLSSTLGIAYFDVNYNFISGVTGSAKLFTVPTGTGIVYMTFAFLPANLNTMMLVLGATLPSYVAYKVKDNQLFIDNTNLSPSFTMPAVTAPSKWLGKKWGALGDSITYGESTTEQYHAYIATDKGVTVTNYGISQSTITAGTNSSNPMAERFSTMDATLDLITVLGGSNDSIKDMPIGASTDTTDVTFYGALDVLYQGLINMYPTKTIAIIIPPQNVYSADSIANLINYVNVIKIVAQRYSLPCLDLYSGLGITPRMPIIKTTYFDSLGLHPNADGHRIMANKIGAFLETL